VPVCVGFTAWPVLVQWYDLRASAVLLRLLERTTSRLVQKESAQVPSRALPERCWPGCGAGGSSSSSRRLHFPEKGVKLLGAAACEGAAALPLELEERAAEKSPRSIECKSSLASPCSSSARAAPKSSKKAALQVFLCKPSSFLTILDRKKFFPNQMPFPLEGTIHKALQELG